MTLDAILARLADPATQADRLLEECRQPDLELWKAYPELYRAFTEKLIRQGHPGRALELAREGAEHLKDDMSLQYKLALAAARGGNPLYAESILRPLLERALKPDADLPTQLRVEIVALEGRILKDQSRQNRELAKASAECYEQAANLPGARELPDGGTFPLINAATMWRLAGDESKSRIFAAETIERINARDAANDDPLWRPATLGEANLLLGRHEEATKQYLRAVELGRTNRIGDLIAMRRNLQLLIDAGISADPKFLDEQIGSVVVFTGHMIDSPDRMANPQAKTRFPNDPKLIAAAKDAIVAKLAEINAKVGYSSLACGGDILFAEAMLERNAELHVLLPFSQHDFLRTSVHFGQVGDDWLDWQSRFLNIWKQVPPDRRRFTTTEPYLGTSGLYTWSGTVIQGIAVMRSHERGGRPQAVCLIDRSQPGQLGGAKDFIASWRAAGHAVHEIDLGALRETYAPAVTTKKLPVSQPPTTSEIPRSMKAMLFADVAGFSGILEWQLAEFLAEYGEYLRCVFRSPVGQIAKYANSWGDGLYVVFDQVPDAAAFAMELVRPKVAQQPNWSKYDLGDTVPFRVGLHTGPVYELPDLFQGRSGFGGQHVNRAARIEPVTVRGCAYASEQFAAVLTVEAGDRFRIEPVGLHSLAKGYDRCPLYRIEQGR